MKSECHTNFARTCVKARHSCCRKIVSYCGLFGKTLFKSAHRGIQKVVGFVGTWAVWDIGIAAKLLAADLSELKQLQGTQCSCYRCAKPKPPGIIFVVLDAGQFYEAHQTKGAIDVVQRLVDIAWKNLGKRP